jgi:Flp pilus assembly protein TadB
LENLILKIIAGLGGASALLFFIQNLLGKKKLEKTKAENTLLKAEVTTATRKLEAEKKIIDSQKTAQTSVARAEEKAAAVEKEGTERIKEDEGEKDKVKAGIDAGNSLVDLFNRL